MGRKSAGLLMYRQLAGVLEVFLIHPGGPFWAKKDFGCWSIPKGECLENEEPFDAARREFQEETGIIPTGEFVELTEIKQTGGKRVKAWAFAGDCDPTKIKSNTFLLEFPPRSGKFQSFPEVDRAAWFTVEDAKTRIVKGQIALLDELQHLLHP
ncbi:MAG: NUDIX domain-containing protein [Oscillatoriales cyanobacterium C42_A2020_001]|nr:NUDIX domain-containing protein [Leptolyngbyaceae cyanobacterium C42_A2020_001]